MAVKLNGKTLAAKPPKVEPVKVEKAKPNAKRRNPTKRGYAAKTFERLFDYVAAGQDLTTACKNPGMPTPWTVRRRMEV
ncbi:hypothetical protein, partial [Paraburkholderia sp. GAS348]|uniref:hypothetical protein n=1 Tax=Paraburkholderia sp. GAS348 TaxID=3035132 RepID=UPI003D1DE3BD